MQFGICTGIENAGAVKAAGWDYIEAMAQPLLQGQLPDEQWTGMQQRASSPLPISAVNVLVPKALPVTGPHANLAALRQYMDRVTARAQRIGVEIIVFGSGGARHVPDGFDRGRA